MIRNTGLSAICVVLAMLASGVAANAAIHTRAFTGQDTFPEQGSLTAHVLFSYDDIADELTVTLTNQETSDVNVPSQLLGAVFFNGFEEGALAKIDARLGTNSEVLYFDPNSNKSGAAAAPDGTLADQYGNGTGDISPEWAFRDDLHLNVFGDPERMLGISATGLGAFGPGDLFDTDLSHDLHNPNSPNGTNYLISSQMDDPLTGNGGVMGEPVIKHQVIFSFDVLSPISLYDLADVVFQYGTGFDEPAVYIDANSPSPVLTIPEPSSLLILGGLLVSLAFCYRRWGQSRASAKQEP